MRNSASLIKHPLKIAKRLLHCPLFSPNNRAIIPMAAGNYTGTLKQPGFLPFFCAIKENSAKILLATDG